MNLRQLQIRRSLNNRMGTRNGAKFSHDRQEVFALAMFAPSLRLQRRIGTLSRGELPRDAEKLAFDHREGIYDRSTYSGLRSLTS
jgi:hypothetical protein